MLSNNQLLFPDDDLENKPKYQCLTRKDFYEIQNTTKSKQLYLHLNILSISYHVDDLAALVANCKTKPKVSGISECRIRTSRFPFSNINIDNYTYEYTPTESSKGGTLLYIDKSVKYKSKNDLHLNKPKEIESTFIEVIETKKNIVCVYKHPKVPIKEFLNDFLEHLLVKLSFEKKRSHSMGGLNINLLNCNTKTHQTT